MNLIEIIEQNGTILRKKATTKGGEFKGKCPWCDGKDRFTAWPSKDRYICRKCGKNGDSIQYLIDFKGVSFIQAKRLLNKNRKFKKHKRIFQEDEWTPRIIKIPSLTWQEQARIILNKSINYLNGPFGKRFKTHLIERGINVSMINRYSLGYNRKDIYASRSAWGLDEILKDNGEPKKVWIPKGHIIPMLDQAGNVMRLRIRRTLMKNDNSDKYIIAPGSHTGFMQFQYNPDNPSMIIESELDSMLCDHISGHYVNVYAVGNASARPDKETHEKLMNSKILFSLDNDDAGKAEFDWWKKQYFLTIRKFCPTNKDVGEFFQAGGDVGKWIDQDINATNRYIDATYCQLPIPKPDKADKPKPITNHSQELKVDPITDRSCLNGYYCNFITYKQNKEFGYHRKICILQEDNEDSIFDKGCPKGHWFK